ncbi:MAG: hypothetical protein LUI06_09765 [Ruminococcus sp.]|nr:hypothetical protein [Ruminococcus sp.]
MKNGIKQEILNIVKEVENELKRKNNTTIFSESGNRNKIGCNQFREIAAECRVAECYDEILLLVEYTIAKSNEWKETGLGKMIINSMQKVRNIGKPKEQGAEADNEKNKRELYNLELFFGYMYWESRILAANNPSGGQSNNKYNNNQKGNYQNNKKSPNQKFNGNTKSDGSFRKKGN